MKIAAASAMDLPKASLAVVMIVVGVAGRLLLLQYANFETVLVSTFFAGALLGGAYIILVPVAIMGVSDILIYAFHLGNQYGLAAIAGIAFFTWTGFMMISVLGRLGRPRVLLATRGIAVLTGIGLVGTLLFDVWTAFGMWLFIASPGGQGLDYVYLRQIPFTVYHLLSSLIFIPLLGTLFIYLDKVGIPRLVSREASLPETVSASVRAAHPLAGGCPVAHAAPSDPTGGSRVDPAASSAAPPSGRAPQPGP
jgi:hypothetical protein